MCPFPPRDACSASLTPTDPLLSRWHWQGMNPRKENYSADGQLGHSASCESEFKYLNPCYMSIFSCVTVNFRISVNWSQSADFFQKTETSSFWMKKPGSPCLEFSRQEYWSGYLFPFPGDLPYPGIEPRLPALQTDSAPSELPGKPVLRQYLRFKRSGIVMLQLWVFPST